MVRFKEMSAARDGFGRKSVVRDRYGKMSVVRNVSRKTISLFAMVIVGVLFTLTLTGCGIKAVTEPDSVGTIPSDKTRVKFSWWGNDIRHAYTMDAVDIFQQKNTDIEVLYRYGEFSGYEKKTKVWHQSDNDADVMQINYSWLQQYSPDGEGYYDLSELSDYLDLSAYSDYDLSFGTQNGKVNAVPIAYNSYVVYHNEDLYKKYGLEVPKTWDDYFAAAKVMSKDGIYPLGAEKKHLVIAIESYYEQVTGKSVFNEDGTLAADEEGMKFMLEFYKKLLDEKVVMSIDKYTKESFGSGDVASAILWISDATSYCENLDADGTSVVIGDYPSVVAPKKSGRYIKPATMYAISKKTEHPEEAAKLLNFLINSDTMAELQGTEKGVPINANAKSYLFKSGLLDTRENEANDKVMAEKDDLSVMIPNMENDDIIEIMKDGADEYLYGKCSVEEAAQNIVSGINEVIASED